MRRSVLFSIFLAVLSRVSLSEQTTQSTAKPANKTPPRISLRCMRCGDPRRARRIHRLKSRNPHALAGYKTSLDCRWRAERRHLLTCDLAGYTEGAERSAKGVTLNSSGLAICAGRPGTCGTADNPDDPIDVIVQPIPGEPVRLGLISADGTTKVFAKIVPNPLHGDDPGMRGRCRFSNTPCRTSANRGPGVPNR